MQMKAWAWVFITIAIIVIILFAVWFCSEYYGPNGGEAMRKRQKQQEETRRAKPKHVQITTHPVSHA